MIASRVGLLVAAALALVLALVVAVDRPGGAPASRALVPGFDTARVTRLAWSRAGEPAVVIERAGEAWRWTQPLAHVPADPDTIDAALAALRGGRWHRRAAIAKAGRLRVALAATAGARTVEVGVGDALEGAGQTWIGIGEHAYLVDDWIARALAPDPLALRETRPLRDVAVAKTIVIDRLAPSAFAARIAGTPRRMVRPTALVLDPVHVAALHRAFAQLAIRGTPKPGASATLMTLSIDAPKLVTVELRMEGCGTDVAIDGTFGPGCIAPDGVAAIDEVIERLRRPSTQLADRVPARVDPLSVTLADGGVLDLEKRPRVGDRDADPVRVAELLAALQTPADAVVDADPAEKPVATLAVAARDGTRLDLELLPGKRLRRRGEPVALVVGAGAWDLLARPASALRDPTLWTEEETTIQTIAIDATTYTRGAVIGEWTRSGPGKDDAVTLGELARALARPRGTDIARAPRVLHTVTFATAPPAGTPVTRTLQIGARCEAIVDGKPVSLEPRVCELIARLR